MTSRCLTLVAVLTAATLASPLVHAQGLDPIVPPFSVSVQAVAGDVLPGQNATYEITIGNTWIFPRNANMTLVSELPPDWGYSFSVDPVPIAANGTNTTTLAIHVPTTAQPQTLTVTIEAKDAWNFTRYEGIPVTVKPAPVDESQPLAPPRLTLSISTGDSAQSGETAAGTLLIQNHDTVRPTVTVQIAPTARDGWRPYVRDVDRTRVLTPGATATIPVFVDIPPLTHNTTKDLDITVSTEGITYSAKWSVLGVLPQEGGQVSATDAAPNGTTSGSTGTSVRPGGSSGRGTGPNLDVFVEPLEVPITSGESTTAHVRLTNTGGTALSVRLEDTPPFTWRGFTFEPSAPVSLAPGETAIVEMTITAPAGIPPGGSSEASVVAIADGLVRQGHFVIKVTAQAPRDETAATLIETPASPDGGAPLPASTVLLAVGLAAVGAGAIAVINRPFREKLLWGAAGLYTRLARPDVLGHEDREKLYRLVETQPGIHFHALQRDLGWNTGTLTYHVRVLERHGFVVSRRDGLYRRFYLSGAAPRKEVFENQGPTGLRADVIEAIRNTPGISQSDLALGLGANKQTVNYHVKALERAGTIRVEKRGRDTFLYPGDAPTPPGPGQAQA